MTREKNPTGTPPRKRAPRKRAAPAVSAPTEAAPVEEVRYPAFVDPQRRAALIARAAYFRALNRGFAPGHEIEDWLAAETEVDAELMSGAAKSAST